VSFVVRDLSCRLLDRAGWLARVVLMLGLVFGVSSVAARSADAAGVPFQRGDVFLAGTGGVQEYSANGQLRGTVPGTAGASVLCFDPSGEHLILPGVGLLDSSGNLLGSSWASVTGAQRCVADGSGHVYVSARPAGYTITKYDIKGTLLQQFPITHPEAHGLAIDLAPDGCTLYYGSWAAPGGAINRLNGCTNAPGTAFTGDNFVDDLRVLPDGQVIVTDDLYARLEDASGQFVRRYQHPSCAVAFACSDSLRTMSLDPDGKSFWVCCAGFKPAYVAEVFRFDIATGQLLTEWASGGGVAMAVYAPPLRGNGDIDSTKPDAAIASVQPSGTTATVPFNSTADDVDRFECSLDNGAFSACISPKVFTGLTAGSHSVSVRAIDKHGNEGDAAERTFTIESPPVPGGGGHSTGGGGGSAGGGGQPAPPATSAPKVTLKLVSARVSKIGAVSLNLGCPASETSCKVGVALKLGRTIIAGKTANLTGGGKVKLTLQLSKSARRQLAKRGTLKASAVVTATDAAWNTTTKFTVKMTLKAPSR
jgi:hypothetical protein